MTAEVLNTQEDRFGSPATSPTFVGMGGQWREERAENIETEHSWLEIRKSFYPFLSWNSRNLLDSFQGEKGVAPLNEQSNQQKISTGLLKRTSALFIIGERKGGGIEDWGQWDHLTILAILIKYHVIAKFVLKTSI